MKVNTIIQHDVTKDFPLPDSCIDVVITSPPYWGLRDYGVDGQIGLEKHPQEYIDKLVGVCREIKRVLKKSGSFYLNLGDTYFGKPKSSTDGRLQNNNYGNKKSKHGYDNRGKIYSELNRTSNWLVSKQLMLIPSRVAIALQDDGWIIRNSIIWHKPNPMPSSVKDRLNNTYEYVFHLVQSKKYYYDLDAIREPHKAGSIDRYKYSLEGCFTPGRAYPDEKREKSQKWNLSDNGKNPGDIVEYNGKFKDVSPHFQSVSERRNYQRQVLGIPHDLATSHPDGKNPGDVVDWDANDLNEEGKPRVSTLWKSAGVPRTTHPLGKAPGDFWDITTQPFTSYSRDLEHFAVFPKELIIKPLKSSCPSGGVVLDPFCGRGTVGRVAKELGLNYVLFDIKPEYCELARLYVNGQKRKLIKNQGRLKV